MNPINNLSLTVSAEQLPKFFQLLEQGFILESTVGCGLRDFICEGLGLDGEYLENKVQTIFLDHNPVDNLDTALIREGSTVALSAAMPGLAGATLRRGGQFAAMRNQISCRTGTACESDQKTKVTVKFFNVIAKDLGEIFFRKGVWIQESSLLWFFNKYLQSTLSGTIKALIDNREIDSHKLAEMPWEEVIFLKLFIDPTV